MVDGEPLHPGDRVARAARPVSAPPSPRSHLRRRAAPRPPSACRCRSTSPTRPTPARGDLIAAADDPPLVTSELEATVCWFGERPLRQPATGCGSSTRPGSPRPGWRVLVTLRRERAGPRRRPTSCPTTRSGWCGSQTGTPLVVDPYRTNRVTGSFVLIDEATNATVAAGMVGAPELAEAVAQD